MVCPYCSTNSIPGARVCTNCGVILKTERKFKPAPKPRMKRVARLRLVGAVIAAVIAGVAAFFLLKLSASYENYRPLGAFLGALIGIALVYVVTGIRSATEATFYRGKIRSLHGQVTHALENSEEEAKKKIEKDQKEGKDPKSPENQAARRTIAGVHLLRGDYKDSVREFEYLRETSEANPEILNNLGISLAKNGDLLQAQDAFEKYDALRPNSYEAASNFARLTAQKQFGLDETSAPKMQAWTDQALNAKQGSTAPLNRLGLYRLHEDQFGKANEAFEKAMQVAKTKDLQADAANNQGIVFLAQKEYKAASQKFQQALKLERGHGRALSNLGLYLLDVKKPREGVDLLQRAAQIDARSSDTQANLGYGLCQLDAINEGIGAFRNALKIDPSAFEALYNLGKTYIDEGILDLSDRYLNQAVKVRPNSWEVRLAYGVTKMMKGDVNEALEDFQAAENIAPDEPMVMVNLGIAKAKLGHLDDAEVNLRRAFKVRPEDAQTIAQLAWLCVQKDEMKPASDLLHLALELEPKNATLHDYYGLVQLGLGSADVAMIHFKRCLALDKNHHFTHYHLGYVHVMKKDLPAALTEWAISDKHESKYADLHTNYGVALYLEERFPLAIEQFRKALFVRHDRMEDSSNLAMAYARAGLEFREASRKPTDKNGVKAVEFFTQAIDMFDRALLLKPENVVLHSNRGLACFYGGKPEESVQEWSLVSRLDPEYARRRGELLTTAFDESVVDFIPMKIADRMLGFPPKTASYLYAPVAGYDTAEWEYTFSDPHLAKVPETAATAALYERKLKALKMY